jgi:hypothetical protein
MTFRTGDRRTGTRHDTNNRKARNIMETNTRNHRKVALTVLALGAATAAVVFGSLAAWTATTANPGNQVVAGSADLSTGTVGAVISETDIAPGDDSGAGEDVVISNGGSTALDVTLTISGVTSNELSDELEVQIHDGSDCVVPANPVTCDTWVTWSDLGAAYSTGSIAAAASRTYNVKWQFPDIPTGNNNAGQSQTASFDLTWDGVQP